MALQLFNFNNNQVRTVLIDGVPWFVAKDVCEVLGIANYWNATSRLGEDERGLHTMEGVHGSPEMTIINESGLYHLIFTSRKPEAEAFRKWVTSEVLPEIRKTGAYNGGMTELEMLAAYANKMVEEDGHESNSLPGLTG